MLMKFSQLVWEVFAVDSQAEEGCCKELASTQMFPCAPKERGDTLPRAKTH